MFLFPLTLLSKQKTFIHTTKVEGFPPLCARMPRHTAFSPVAFSFHWVNKPEILCESQVGKLEHIFLFRTAAAAAAARWALMGCSCTCWWQAQLEHAPVISGTGLHTSAQHVFTYYKTSLKNISVPVNSISSLPITGLFYVMVRCRQFEALSRGEKINNGTQAFRGPRHWSHVWEGWPFDSEHCSRKIHFLTQIKA